MKKIIAFLKEVQAIIYHLEKEAASRQLGGRYVARFSQLCMWEQGG